MISENLLCESLPSPVLGRAGRSQSASDSNGSGREKYGYFDAGMGSVGSSGSEGSQSSKRGSLREERRVKWKGTDM